MADKNFSIESDSPANGDLMFWSIVGQECLSRPAHYELTVLSTRDDIAAKDVLGHAFDVIVKFHDADDSPHERHCQGHAVRFMRRGQAGRYFEYRITLRSWFWLLTKRMNSRILQDKAAMEIFDAVVDDSPVGRFKKTKVNLIGKHEPRRYSVQHQESDYDYLSRLLEDEGVYYWFDAHTAPGTMRLADDAAVAHEKLPVLAQMDYIPFGSTEARFGEITRWVDSHRLQSGKFASRDSDFKAIKKKLVADKDDPDTHELADLEFFEFAGGYFRNDDTEDAAKVRMEELVARRQLSWAVTRWPDVAVGSTFTFHGHPMGDADADFLVAGCSFVLVHEGYEGMDEHGANVQRQGRVLLEMMQEDPLNADWRGQLRDMVYGEPNLIAPMRGVSTFLLTVLPAQAPFRPPRVTQRVTMPGPQSAIVVGPAGEEIHADDFGRVKVHFHWDRYDESNEKSTCWVRVSQPWAGKGWGGYFIPRIGQEVIVDFLNGDPDRPIIIGRVYNDDQPKPFDSHTQSGFRTRSTPGGSAANCNEFRFDDKKGSEQVYLHAEKNQDISVENDETHTVGHDRTKTIDHDETTHVKHDRTETVDNNETITIGVDRTESVGNNESITIGVNRTESVGANEDITIGANRTESVGANESITIGANRSVTVGSNETKTVAVQRTHTVGANETITIGAAQEVTVGAAQAITVGADQTVSVGANQSSNIGADRSVSVGAKLSTDVGADESRSVAGGRSTTVGKDETLTVSKNLSISAGDSISIVTGDASISMKKDGTIVIKGKNVTVEGSGKINVKASSDVVIKGSKVGLN
ncbi:type VI secretion system tip protein TssI/VgrG [Variovorax dokdonensis]|uniref:Type VI secretion system tip protein TssI/VgrG n=1 Tax=Variovorax dokdonensis TaxID=344883 RepID=A0ABT7NAK6_9BURK|nr:type VI secretion system tip protein TssI/VgrG [Variovorax dokdonensis]MDM0044962.1 type VI secretion system tip protein TssI/VgrG [Variovorax dokdonensis]